MEDSDDRVQQPDEVVPVVVVLPELTPVAPLPVAPPVVVVVPPHAFKVGIVMVGALVVERTPGVCSIAAELVSGDETTSDGTVTIGLTPTPTISVDPSGMVPPPSDELAVAPGV
jgi:hypothetical protein